MEATRHDLPGNATLRHGGTPHACILVPWPVAAPGCAAGPFVVAVMTAPGHVTVMRCPRCGGFDAGAATRCRSCGSEALDRTEVPGRGRLVSWTVVRRPAGAFAHRGTFAVALVDLDAGPRLTGNLEGWEREPPPGAAVRVTGETDGIPSFTVETSPQAPAP